LIDNKKKVLHVVLKNLTYGYAWSPEDDKIHIWLYSKQFPHACVEGMIHLDSLLCIKYG